MNWIDLKKLRQELSFRQVLQHYGVELKIKGHRAVGRCPLPDHQPTTSANDRSTPFSADLERGLFRCFGCKAGGNHLDFAVLMEGKNPEDGKEVVTVARKLQGALLPQSQGESAAVRQQKASPKAKIEPAQTTTLSHRHVVVNAPLDFSLKNLDAEHPYLLDRGFTAETIRHFGLGYCSRGHFKNRIVIPIHDLSGRLVGYAGRITNDREVTTRAPKYLFPPSRERDDKIHEFHKETLLYNAHRLSRPVKDLVLVTTFSSVWWLHQLGIKATVSLIGSNCSGEQVGLLDGVVEPLGRIWLLLDGQDLAPATVSAVASLRHVRLVKLRCGQKITKLSTEDLPTLLPAFA
jgi:DNA primase